MNSFERKAQDSASIVLAVIFIALGVLFLLDQWLQISLGAYLWPFAIIIPGILLFLYALGLREREGVGVACGASVVSALGLLLLFQNTTGLWATWAYAWALVAPTAVGLGMIVYGMIKQQPGVVSSGVITTKVGIGLFIGFAAFFELLLNISGLNIGSWALPLLLITVGVYTLWRATRRS